MTKDYWTLILKGMARQVSHTKNSICQESSRQCTQLVDSDVDIDTGCTQCEWVCEADVQEVCKVLLQHRLKARGGVAENAKEEGEGFVQPGKLCS